MPDFPTISIDYAVLRELLKRAMNELPRLMRKHGMTVDSMCDSFLLEIVKECRDNIGFKSRWVSCVDLILEVQARKNKAAPGASTEGQPPLRGG